MSTDLEALHTTLGVPSLVQKHIILLKLAHLYECIPDFSGLRSIDAKSPQRRWLSEARALLNRYDAINFGTRFNVLMGLAVRSRGFATNELIGLVLDAIEAIKLDLELDGRSEIGTAYSPGEEYRYFSDLKRIIAGATTEILLIDPYFDGASFDAYLSDSPANISIRIMAARYAKDIPAYAERHSAEFGTLINIRSSKELHDRLVVIDDDECWISGASIKDAGSKATYLIPLSPTIAEAKRQIYAEIWQRGKELE